MSWPQTSHLATKCPNACWMSGAEEASKTMSSAKRHNFEYTETAHSLQTLPLLQKMCYLDSGASQSGLSTACQYPLSRSAVLLPNWAQRGLSPAFPSWVPRWFARTTPKFFAFHFLTTVVTEVPQKNFGPPKWPLFQNTAWGLPKGWVFRAAVWCVSTLNSQGLPTSDLQMHWCNSFLRGNSKSAALSLGLVCIPTPASYPGQLWKRIESSPSSPGVEPVVCLELSSTISSWYISASHNSSGSFPTYYELVCKARHEDVEVPIYARHP